MKEYEINEETMAIVPVSFYKTKVIEIEREIIVLENAYKLMDYNCRFYGSTYKGRYNAGKKMLNSSYKIPIIIHEGAGIIFFPTRSSLDEECAWINYNYVKSIEKGDNKTRINFTNNTYIESDRSKLSLNNQLARSMQLESIMRRRANSIYIEKR